MTLEEIRNLTREGGKPAETLMNVVALIARRFRTDVCSAYLLEPDRANLVLAATLGLRRECVGTLRLALHEGLAGLVAEQVHPVAVEKVSQHPRFKFFRESGEEQFQSFLGVPLIDRGVLQECLVVQTIDSRVFLADEIRMLMDAAAQLAPVVSEARMLDRFVAPAQERLWALARNLWWSWDQDCVSLFRDLDPVRFRKLNNNPVSLLSRNASAGNRTAPRSSCCTAGSITRTAGQQEYLQAYRTWGASNAGILRPRPVAYFSAEFGLHESIPIYSGGLGVLVNDHIKSASDLDIPLIGIGLFTDKAISAKGWTPPDGNWKITSRRTSANCRWNRRSEKNGMPVTIRIDTRSGWIRAKSMWRLNVGRCDLLLLDSNVEGNAPEDRELTSRLYGGDGRTDSPQELLLGVGGVRALREMGITPGVYHMNEGHSVFAVLDAVRTRMADEGISFDQAVPEGHARGRIHDPYAGVRQAYRPLSCGPDRRTPGAAAGRARDLA